MSNHNQHQLKFIKCQLYNLHSADIPKTIFFTEAAIYAINGLIASFGYPYRFFPVSIVKGGNSERSD